MSQPALITRRDILNHGASSAMMDEFEVRAIGIRIEVGGALGAMSASWRLADNGIDEPWSQPKTSSSAAPWTWDLPDPAWASITFPAATYSEGSEWVIGPDGTVTQVGGTTQALTAVRSDVVATKIAEVSSKIAEWTQPRCVAPIVSLGEGQKGDAARLVVYWLKSRNGLTPQDAGAGDDNVRALAERAQRNFEAIGRSDKRPPDLIDSSSDGLVGAGIGSLPQSRSARGFGDF